MEWCQPEALSRPARELYAKLRAERVAWDLADPAELTTLRADVARIARDMDDDGRPPPMFWSGVPWPPPGPEPSCGLQAVISIGGTKTDFALLRLDHGEVVGLDVRDGHEVRTVGDIDAVKAATQMATPRLGPQTRTGQDMIAAVVAHLAPFVRAQRASFERCDAILLAWGFPHRVIRTGSRLACGLSARSTSMTKDQGPFSASLEGKDLGVLLGRELQRQTGWTCPIAVANDTVMALHYFLHPERRAGHGRVGLFINGTGTNFSAAEPYAVRPEGCVSRPGEDYVPARITPARPLRAGEREERYFVNYESGSTDLVATRTRFDIDPLYPIERNALAGGNAFHQQLRAYLEEMVAPAAFGQLVEAWRRRTGDPTALPGGPTISHLLGGQGDALLAGIDPDEDMHGRIRLVARAIVARSALHAALVLAAITARTGFGLGSEGAPDLLGMEGSVWRSPGYPDLVRHGWQELVGQPRLRVDLAAEPDFNASLSGPLYLAALHR